MKRGIEEIREGLAVVEKSLAKKVPDLTIIEESLGRMEEILKEMNISLKALRGSRFNKEES